MTSIDSSRATATTTEAGSGATQGMSSPEAQRGDATSTNSSIVATQPVNAATTNTASAQGGSGNGSGTGASEEEGEDDDGEDQPCQACGVFPAKFQCSACQSVRYCSQECQASDWKIHYRECAEIVAAMKEEQEQQVGEEVDGTATRRRSQRPRSRSSVPRSQQQQLVGDAAGHNAEGGDTQAVADRPRIRQATGEIEDPLGAEAENVRATANRPRRRPREPRRRPQLTPEQRAAFEEAERIADMKFYMLQVYKIIKPVVICICLSILWVKISMAGSDYRPTQSSYTVYNETSTSTVSQNILGSLANAGIIIAQIVIVTIIIVVLFKRGHIKVLIGFFMVVVAMLLGFMGYILVLNLIQVLRIPMDYVTMSFALWNFAVTGLISVFWKGPMWLQQVYLTVMSSLMAFSLTGLAEWTTWMLLALLVVWDLIAVLCPFGPLKILVESSRNQNQEVPALLYTVNAVWFMASPPNSILNREVADKMKNEGLESDDGTLDGVVSSAANNNQGTTTSFAMGHARAMGREADSIGGSSRNSALDASFAPSSGMSRASSTMALYPSSQLQDMTNDSREHIELRDRPSRTGPGRARGGDRSSRQDEGNRRSSGPSRRSEDTVERQEDENEDEDDDGGGLKLGLGDFVFYSVLIARAAMFDWVTTMCCTVAVLTGMNATIFLLAIYQKALPALPISICFGMLFYFATRFALVPFLAVLGTSQIFI